MSTTERTLVRTLAPATVFLVALCLRPALTAVGPLLPQIGPDLGLGEGAQGLLGTLPLLAFAAASPLVHRLSERTGPERAILVALLALGVATLARPFTGTAGLWLATAVIGVAIAVGNVLVPALVKRDFARRVSLATGVYTACIVGAAATASALAVPLADATSWRVALASSAGLVVLVAAVWAPRAWRARPPAPHVAAPGAAPVTSVWRQGTAWWLTAFMGLQSTVFYVLVTWLPTVEGTQGVTETTAGVHLFVYQGLGIVGGLVVPALLHRGPDERLGAVAASAPALVALLGLLLAPDLVVLWVVVAGLGQGAALVVALSLVALRGRDQRETARLSGMAQSLGYLLAAAGPVAAGVLTEATGTWRPALLVLTALAAVQVGVAWRVGRA
jgi:CP family cyanate transporter-like MFS transporter